MNMETMMKLSSDKKTPTSRKVEESMMKLEFDKNASTIQNSNPFRGENVHKAEQSSPILKKEKNTEPPCDIMHKPKANNAQNITSTARCENKTPKKKLENNFQDKQLRKQRSSVNSRHSGKSYIGRLPIYADAWYNLRRSIVHYNGQTVGTIAAMDDSECVLNYDQVFVRDFVPSALAFLMNGEEEIVKNFLTRTLQLQASLKTVDCFTLAQGVMPASFKVLNNSAKDRDKLVADFGDTAIGRVAPVDSGFWWIFLLYAYTKATGDSSLSQNSDFQTGMKLILSLCLHDGYETSPTLLCSDACCMIDRRLGIYGHPIEIQSLFNMALRCAHQLLKPDGEGKEYIQLIEKRLPALDYHMSSYFWLDYKRLNDIYRYKTDEYSHNAINKFNVNPASIPYWLFDFMPMTGGYFIGNVSPGQMDFRWFALGNCLAILSSLATEEQSTAIMDLIEQRWEELVGHMPMKVVYPALQDNEWSTVTGRDPKNTKWSYHNGGSWPVLLWALVAASVKTNRLHIARKAVDLAELRLPKDTWPEYYDGKDGNFVGKQSRNFQTWSIAGYLVAKMMLDDPSHLRILAPPEIIIKAVKPILDRATTMPPLQR